MQNLLSDLKNNDVLKFIVYICIFLGTLIFLVIFYILTYYCCGRRDEEFIDDSVRKNRNKLLEFNIDREKWPERTKSRTREIERFKNHENKIKKILANK